MQVIRYDLIGAYYAGINKHPQIDMQDLGIKIIQWEAIEIGDCIMAEVENLPETLPSYIELSNFKFENTL